MNEVINAEHVTRRYSQFVAVDSVSFHVRKGELVALLGSNGAGKTSLMEVLQGATRPAEGRAQVFGLDPIADRARVRQRTGIMLQEAGFARDLTVRETLRMWAGTLTDPRPVDESLGMCGLSERADIRVGSLSGGERRRLDLAMATLGRPELLFMDEPTTGLDPAVRQMTWDLVRAMLDEGATVLLTTHYMEEAEALCDRVAVIDHGRVIALDSIPALVAAHGGQAEVRLTLSAPAPRALADVEGVTSVRADGAVTVVGGTGAFAQAVLSHLAQAGVTVQNMETHSPGLEEVFLNLTGRAVRDA